MQDDPRSGQPKTQRTDANVDRVRTLVRSDLRLGVRVIAEELNMNRETVRHIVNEDLGMRKFSAKMMTRILTHDKRQRQLHISSDLRISLQKFTSLSPLRFLALPKIKKCPEGTKIC